MAKNKGNPATLRVPTSEEARINGKKGGLKSVEVRKERRLLSQIYRDFLASQVPDLGISGEELLETVATRILLRGDSASVSLMKEIREATEGSKIDLTGKMTYQVIPAKKPDANN